MSKAQVNEWKYLNFDMENKVDATAVEKIHEGFDDMRRLAVSVISSTIGDKASNVYKRTLLIPGNNDDEEEVPNVDDNCGPGLKKFIIDEEDFGPDAGLDLKCDGETFAYTDLDTSKTYFCADIGLILKRLLDLSAHMACLILARTTSLYSVRPMRTTSLGSLL